MRILIYTNNKEQFVEQNQEQLDNLDELYGVKADLYSDIDEIEYCMSVRVYSLIFAEYNENKVKNFYNIIAEAKRNNIEIFIFGDFSNSFHFNRLKTDYNPNIIEGLFDLTKEVKQRIKTSSNKYISCNIKDRKILVELNNVKTELEFEKTLDFFVMLYFIRNYDNIVCFNSLLSACCSEPEYVRNSSVDSSIASIRKMFQDCFNINPIVSLKKIGYKFSLEVAK